MRLRTIRVGGATAYFWALFPLAGFSAKRCNWGSYFSHPSLGGNKIDQRRHADMRGAFADGAVMLADFKLRHVAESAFEHDARVQPFGVLRPTGFVDKLLRSITLHQQETAGL